MNSLGGRGEGSNSKKKSRWGGGSSSKIVFFFYEIEYPYWLLNVLTKKGR